MTYLRLIHLIDKGCVNYIQKLNNTPKFKTKLLSKTEEMKREFQSLRVGRFIIFTDKKSTLIKVMDHVKGRKNRMLFSKLESTQTKKINDEVDFFLNRYERALTAFLSGDKIRFLAAMIKVENDARD